MDPLEAARVAGEWQGVTCWVTLCTDSSAEATWVRADARRRIALIITLLH